MAKEVIKQIIADAENVKPIAEFNGIKITTFEDGVTLRKAESFDDDIDISGRLLNPDGSVARSNTKYASVNPHKMFANRVRVIEKDKKKILQVVRDYRAISEQATGSVYLKNIPVYEIVRNSETKALEINSVTSVLDTEFVSEFRNTLDKESLLEILPLIESHSADTTAVGLGI